MKPTRISKNQRAILERMKAGESLEQDGWGIFSLVKEGQEQHTATHVCRRLHERGFIGEDKREVHSGYVRGGLRIWYVLTEQGKEAIR